MSKFSEKVEGFFTGIKSFIIKIIVALLILVGLLCAFMYSDVGNQFALIKDYKDHVTSKVKDKKEAIELEASNSVRKQLGIKLIDTHKEEPKLKEDELKIESKQNIKIETNIDELKVKELAIPPVPPSFHQK